MDLFRNGMSTSDFNGYKKVMHELIINSRRSSQTFKRMYQHEELSKHFDRNVMKVQETIKRLTLNKGIHNKEFVNTGDFWNVIKTISPEIYEPMYKKYKLIKNERDITNSYGPIDYDRIIKETGFSKAWISRRVKEDTFCESVKEETIKGRGFRYLIDNDEFINEAKEYTPTRGRKSNTPSHTNSISVAVKSAAKADIVKSEVPAVYYKDLTTVANKAKQLMDETNITSLEFTTSDNITIKM